MPHKKRAHVAKFSKKSKNKSILKSLSLPQTVNLSSLQNFRQNQASIFNWREMVGSEHYVQFYETDAFLIRTIREYISTGDSAVVIATKEHIEVLKNELKSFGFTISGSHNIYSNLVLLDAQTMLSKFMVHSMPDAELFFKTMNEVLKSSKQYGPKIRAYGEMVAVLWDEGKTDAAILLEELWDELQIKQSFSLLCAYPLRNFANNTFAKPFMSVCSHHSHVLPAESYAKLETNEERLREIASLQQKALSLEVELHKTKHLERQKEEFLAIASHELKTPVTSLKIYGQSLKSVLTRLSETNPALEHVEKMEKQVDRLSGLVNDLLDISKIQAGKIEFNVTDFNIAELMEEISEQMQQTTSRHTIVTSLKQNVFVHADRERIAQVLINLLSNAIKYSPQAHEVILECKVQKTNILVSVKDFGIGIDKKSKKMIFDKFYRARDSFHDSFPGLGLGLYISNEIILRHNGNMAVTSSKGKGSCFTFTLPLNNF